jgi:hypothetical protein
MTVEAAIFVTLKALVANRVYRDLAPQTVTALPRITFQQVGGQAINFLAGVPSKKNAVFQINVWAATRDAAAALSRQVEDAMRGAATVQVSVNAAPVAVWEPDTELYGTRQDFSIWYDN